MSVRNDVATLLAECSFGSKDCAYIYARTISGLMLLAMEVDSELGKLQREIERLNELLGRDSD